MQIANLYNRGLAVTTSDTVDLTVLNGTRPSGLWVGGAGVVIAVWEDGTTSAFTCVAGQLLPFRLKRVNNTSTTATLMIALYQV